MKKSNKVAFIIALIISAFLLWLWFWLGFDHIDAPLDLVLSIIWWVLVAIAAFAIHRIEKKRQERVRTCYVASNHIFNSEAGTRSATTADEVVDSIYAVLKDLDYNMQIKDMPTDADGNPVRYDYVVRSKVFDAKKRDDQQDQQVQQGQQDQQEDKTKWQGEVAIAVRPDDDPLPFESRYQLRQLMRDLYANPPKQDVSVV